VCHPALYLTDARSAICNLVADKREMFPDNHALLASTSVSLTVRHTFCQQSQSITLFLQLTSGMYGRLFNRSLERGIVPPSFKSGYITPLLKKADLDADDVKSYRPITNLSVASKLLERLVAQQLVKYLPDNGLLYASPNRPHFHSVGFLRQGSWRLPRC